eukprot:TRINITY_DN36253_c0_g1_i1.p1 TRINITY_DN36253_c0_g1~~TRINITY_DN36253_c0_g1_i1.p1  ORF type:complete len:373 (-),score=64.16 TRINITY_DN36253_c0_g1_i1:299-1360(-)
MALSSVKAFSSARVGYPPPVKRGSRQICNSELPLSRMPSRKSSSAAASNLSTVLGCCATGVCLHARSKRTGSRELRSPSTAGAAQNRSSDADGSFFEAWAAWLEEKTVADDKLGLREDVLPPHLAQKVSDASARAQASISGKVWVADRQDSPIRRMRYVLVDSGDELQAFNAVIYPAYSRGPRPVLGIDVLSFNHHRRLLFGVDWAPMLTGSDYAEEFISPHVSSVRQRYDAVRADPSNKFYGELPEFFSPYMFFSRPAGEQDLLQGSDLWSVFEEYTERYLTMLMAAPDADDEAASKAMERQTAYDVWHSERDPALPIFRRMFGEDWTETYAREVLFPGVAAPGKQERTSQQ